MNHEPLNEMEIVQMEARHSFDRIEEKTIHRLIATIRALQNEIVKANSILTGCGKHGRYEGMECIGCAMEAKAERTVKASELRKTVEVLEEVRKCGLGCTECVIATGVELNRLTALLNEPPDANTGD